MVLAQELQKARAVTEDFVRPSPENFGPPKNSGLVKGNALGSPPNEYGTHDPAVRGSPFNPCHARFPSNSTTSTAFFDIEEKADAGIADEIKPGQKSLSIITAWPTRAATPPPLLSPFKEKSNGAAPGDDRPMTPNITQKNSMARCTLLMDSAVLPADADQVLLRRIQSQNDIPSTVRTSSRSPSSPFKEGLRVQAAPAIVVEQPVFGHKIPMEIPVLSVEEHGASSRANDTQVPRRPATDHGFVESSSTALGLSPSIYLSPMHEAQLYNNSLDLANKPEIERGLSTPSFISGVLQAGLLLEKLERENTTSFEEDTEAVHFQVLTAVVGTGKQASSSSSLSHYSTEESPDHSQLHSSGLRSTSTIYVTTTDLSTAGQPSLPNAPTPSLLHNPDLHPHSNDPPHLVPPPASTSVVGPLPRPYSTIVSDSTSFVHDRKANKVPQGAQLLKPIVDTAEPISTRVEGRPFDGFLSTSDSKPQLKVSADPSSFSRRSDTGVEEGPNQGVQVITPSPVSRAATRSMGQSSEKHLSSPQMSTLRPLSASGSASVSPVSPSSVISRASARLTNPFSFLHPSPLSSTSPYSSDMSPAGPRRLLKTPEQPKSHKRSETLTPGNMKRPSSARQRLSRFLGGVDFGVGKASSPTRDKADAELAGPDVFGAGEGKESWIRGSRESAMNHGGPPSSDNNADREAATAVQEGKTKKRRNSARPTSMIWLGSNKEKSPVVARDGKKSTKVPSELHRPTQPPPSSDSNSWSMLDASALSAVRNNEGLRIINVPPSHAIGATIDIPRPHKSRSRRKSVVISNGGEESETEAGQMKGRSRSGFLGSLIRK